VAFEALVKRFAPAVAARGDCPFSARAVRAFLVGLAAAWLSGASSLEDDGSMLDTAPLAACPRELSSSSDDDKCWQMLDAASLAAAACPSLTLLLLAVGRGAGDFAGDFAGAPAPALGGGLRGDFCAG